MRGLKPNPAPEGYEWFPRMEDNIKWFLLDRQDPTTPFADSVYMWVNAHSGEYFYMSVWKYSISGILSEGKFYSELSLEQETIKWLALEKMGTV